MPGGKASEIRKTLDFLFDQDQVVELRAIGVSRTGYKRPHVVAGFFDADHRPELVEAAHALTRIHRRTPMDGVRTGEGGG